MTKTKIIEQEKVRLTPNALHSESLYLCIDLYEYENGDRFTTHFLELHGHGNVTKISLADMISPAALEEAAMQIRMFNDMRNKKSPDLYRITVNGGERVLAHAVKMDEVQSIIRNYINENLPNFGPDQVEHMEKEGWDKYLWYINEHFPMDLEIEKM